MKIFQESFSACCSLCLVRNVERIILFLTPEVFLNGYIKKIVWCKEAEVTALTSHARLLLIILRFYSVILVKLLSSMDISSSRSTCAFRIWRDVKSWFEKSAGMLWFVETSCGRVSVCLRVVSVRAFRRAGRARHRRGLPRRVVALWCRTLNPFQAGIKNARSWTKRGTHAR